MSELSTEELIAQKQSWLTQDVSNLKVDIVFSDMDETFLHTDKSLDDNNMAMLDRLAEQAFLLSHALGARLTYCQKKL